MKPTLTIQLIKLIFLLLAIPSTAPGQSYYWIGGGGDWQDPTHWSYSSGGPHVSNYPSWGDDVYFDQNSFTTDGDTVDMSGATVSRIDFTGITYNTVLKGNGVWIANTIILDSHLVCDPSLSIFFAGGNLTLHTADVKLGYLAIGDVYQDNLTLTGDLHARYINLRCDYFNSGGFDVYAETIRVNESAASFTSHIYLFGSSTLHCSNFISDASSLSNFADLIDLANATIIFGETNAGVMQHSFTKSVLGKVIIKNNLEINDNQFNNAVTIDSLFLENAGYITDLNTTIKIEGDMKTSSALTQLSSSGGIGYIYKSFGQLCIDNIILHNIHTAGAANFYAGTSSVDLGNNIGWTFNACGSSPDGYYWVNGSGNWSDHASHWATTSGGNVFHTSPPDSADNVYIDANSFSLPGEIIFLDYPADCRNFNADQLSFPASIEDPFGVWDVRIKGSLVQNALLSWTGINSIYLDQNNLHKLVDTEGAFIGRHVILHGHCILESDISSEHITNYGAFNTNHFTLNVDTLHAFNTEFGNSIINSSFVKIGNLSDESNAVFNMISNDSVYFETYNGAGTVIMNNKGSINAGIGVIRKLVLEGDVKLLNGLKADTVLFNNPGDSVILTTGITLEINEHIASNGVSGMPVHLVTTGGFSTMHKSNGVVCLKNIAMRNIVASGGSQFFADTSCIDQGGNTGWQFQPCNIISDVWPGDANYDLIVDNHDVLNIGLAFGETGPIRPAASLAYVAQPADDWSSFFQSAVNKKHADTNGDGIINSDDTDAITLNYGLSHPARIPEHADFSAGIPLFIEINPDTVSPGDSINVNFYLGDNSASIDSIYGIAFSLLFNSAIVNPGSFTFDYSGSWLGNPGNLLTFQNTDITGGKVDYALTRTDHNNTSGYGLIGSMAMVANNHSSSIPVIFKLDDIRAITLSEHLLHLTGLNDSIILDSTAVGIDRNIIHETISIYPNPATDIIHIKCSDKINEIEIIDYKGSIHSIASNSKETELSVSHLSSGIYMLRLKTESGTSIKRLVINSTTN